MSCQAVHLTSFDSQTAATWSQSRTLDGSRMLLLKMRWTNLSPGNDDGHVDKLGIKFKAVAAAILKPVTWPLVHMIAFQAFSNMAAHG